MSYQFNNAEKNAVYRAMAERRDMRHFNQAPLEEEKLQTILRAAHMAPSVGLMQPWRFIRIKDQDVRQAMQAMVEQERIATAKALGEREEEFMRLKVEGMNDCAEILVVALCDQREKHIFGRRTMPHMDLASVSCAIQNMWLAARVEGVGMGWVSLFDPEQLKALLSMPDDADPVAILCLGYVDQFYEQPMLIQEKWAASRALSDLVFHDKWENT